MFWIWVCEQRAARGPWRTGRSYETAGGHRDGSGGRCGYRRAGQVIGRLAGCDCCCTALVCRGPCLQDTARWARPLPLPLPAETMRPCGRTACLHSSLPLATHPPLGCGPMPGRGPACPGWARGRRVGRISAPARHGRPRQCRRYVDKRPSPAAVARSGGAVRPCCAPCSDTRSHLALDEPREGQVVEEVGKALPHVGAAVLAQALVIEAVPAGPPAIMQP